MEYADDGFGNLIPTKPQPEGRTRCYARLNGKLASWVIDTDDHRLAINTLKNELRHDVKPVLAVIDHA